MVYEGVVETLEHVTGKLLQLVHRQVEGLHELVELNLVNVLANDLMVASIANDVDTAEESNGREHGVRTIEQGNLTLVVGFLRGNKQYVQTSLVSRELLLNLLRCLNDPEVEVLSLYDEVVAIANLLLNLGNLLAGEARNDAVYESCIDTARLVEPLLEVSRQLPQLDVLIDAFFQHVAIEEDELAGEDDETLGGVTVKGLPTAIEQLDEFARIAAGGFVIELARRIESNTCLSSVRDDETNLRLVGQCHESIVLRVGVQRATDDVDALQGVDGLTVLTTLQVNMIQTVLTVQPVDHTLVDGLYDDNRTIEVGLLVHIPDNPINKSTEEVTLTKLNHLFRHHALRSEVFV